MSFTGLTKRIIKGLATFPSEKDYVKENNNSIVKDLLQYAFQYDLGSFHY